MFKRFLYIFLFLLAGVAAFAQQYPVQGSLAIASPYPANLSDYANSNIQSLALNLTLTDLTMANKRVRLKVFIQTQNATIAQSIDNVSGEALIMLDGGIPQRFTNTELAHYFRLENLQGINPDGYARSLPEGVYTIGFEVYDYFTGNKLSGRIAQTFWIIINDPPLLNTPQDKSKIADFTSGSQGTGGIIFNWTPRSSQVTNTEYEFTLCELWDPAGDPYQQFMSAIPKYQTTVSNTTTLIYNQAQPSLISGYTYAWRVRAKAKAGFEDVGLYRNDGYSNLFTFRYGDPCPAPQSLALEAKTSDAISATWDTPVGATTGGIRYKIAYRKYSAAGQWSWAETETFDLFRTISDLEPATEYELKVGVPCSQTNEVVYTASQRAITLAAGQISGIECGKEPTIDLSKQTLLTLLKAGDVVMANDFPTTISSVTGTSQGWSGEAWTKVPWLGDTRIHVTYASIKVNSDYKLIDGSFITTYDPTGKNIGDIDKTIDDAVGLYTGGTDVGKVVTGTAATTYTVPYTITPADTVGSTFTANTTGGGTITLGNGQTLTVSNLPTTVQDAAGTVYQADDKGKLTKVGTNSSNAGAMLATANLTVVDASKGTVTFAPTSDMKYAFDAWQKAYDGNSAWSKRYETLPLSGGAKGGSYRVSSKLMVPGEADKVLAIINLNNKNLAADSVRFVNAKGTLFEKKKITDNSCELSLVGGPAGDAQEVYAIYPSPQGEGAGVRSYTLGKLLVATYEPKTINLALVPVNGAKLDSTAIARELKKVYEPLGIDFNLTTKDKFEYEALETASLKVEGSGLLSVYTDQMKALNAAFVAKGDCDKNTIYLFAIDQPESQDGKSIEGVMPRGQQFGYMFVKGKEGDEQGLTATHEIGHGIFQLQHVFDYSGIKQKAIAPLNVMDYPAGEALSKLQWDLMHDPGLVISVFETDKGAQSSVIKASKLLDWIKANLGKIDANYQKTDFYENESIIDVPLYVSGTNKETIKLYAELNSTGKVNLYKDQDNGILGIQVSFDLTNRFHNGFNLSFTYSDKTMTETPVKLWCYSYKDFENLLQYLGLKLNQSAKTRIIQDYKNAIQAANGNCDKLDVIYETIPDFVLAELTDKLLLENLNSLASCQMSDMVVKFLLGWGVDTNEELAALNILRNIKDKLYLFNYLNANPKLALNLYQKIDGEKNREELIKLFLEISQVYWKNNTTLVNNAYQKENIFFLINGIQNHGRITGDQVELWGVKFAGGISTVNEMTPTGLHDLFAPVYVVFTQEANTNNNLYYTVPAIYFYHIVQGKDFADNIKALEVTAQFLSVYASAYTVVSATGKIAKAIAWTALLNDATRLFFDNSNLKTYIGTQPWGEDFIKGYYALSTGIDIVNIAHASVTALTNNTSEVRKVLVANNATAEELAEYDRLMIKMVSNGGEIFKNVHYDDFIKTFAATEEQYRRTYQLWGEEKWDELYQYFKNKKLNGGWPPFDGFISKETKMLKKGTILDRYDYNGASMPDGIHRGEYASPKKPDGSDYSYEERALEGNVSEYTEYYEIRVLEDIDVEFGKVIPWHNHSGNGMQIKFSKDIKDLVDTKKIEIINIKKLK